MASTIRYVTVQDALQQSVEAAVAESVPAQPRPEVPSLRARAQRFVDGDWTEGVLGWDWGYENQLRVMEDGQPVINNHWRLFRYGILKSAGQWQVAREGGGLCVNIFHDDHGEVPIGYLDHVQMVEIVISTWETGVNMISSSSYLMPMRHTMRHPIPNSRYATPPRLEPHQTML